MTPPNRAPRSLTLWRTAGTAVALAVGLTACSSSPGATPPDVRGVPDRAEHDELRR